MRGLVAAMILVSLVACTRRPTTPARIDGTAAAAERFARAKAAYASHDFATAAVEFEAAFELHRKPDYLFGWAQSVRRSGHCFDAVRLYDRLLAFELHKEQRAATQQARSLCPFVVAEPWYRDRVAHAVALAGVTLVGAGTWATMRSVDDERAARAAADLEEHIELGERARRYRTYGIASFSAGALFVGIAVIRYLSTDDLPATKPEPEGVRVGGWIGGGGGGVTLGVPLR